MEKKIEFISGAVLVIIFGVLMFLSARYMMYSDYLALNCDFNSVTHELIACK